MMSEKSRCPKCGKELSEGVAFCEECGAKVPVVSSGHQTPAEPEVKPAGSPTPTVSSSRSKRLVLGSAAALLLVAVGFGGGYLVADDSDQVSVLQSELASTQDELNDAQNETSELSEELDSTAEDRDSLASKLKAERSISGELPSPDQSIDVSADADYVLGEAGIVGPTVMRPTSLDEVGPSGGGTKYALSVDVKNDGKQPINPFCGGEEATIVDTAGRQYSGESVLDFSSPNCGDDIQPGLTKSGYLMEFTLPADAKPALIELVYDIFSDDEPVTWAVN